MSSSTPTGGDASPSPGELGETNPLRILLVDDNPVNRVVASRLLARLGYEVATADDGLQAVEAATSDIYDLILMDIAMPGLDGVQATERIRSLLPADRWPRIVAFTAHALDGDREYYLRSGLDAYLAKPVQMRELTRVLLDTSRLPIGEPPATPPAASSARNDAGARSDVPGTPGEQGGSATRQPASGPSEPSTESLATPVLQSDPFDRAALAAMFGADYEPMLATLLPVYFADSELQIGEMRAGLHRGDHARVAQSAHSLKGASAGMALPLVVHGCEAIEIALEAGRIDEIAALIDTVQQRIDAIRADDG